VFVLRLLARLVAVAVDDQERLPAVAPGADRARGPARGDEHRIERAVGRDRRGEDVRTHRMGFREEEPAVEDRQRSRDDDVTCVQIAALRAYDAGRSLFDIQHARAFEDRAVAPVHALRECGEVLARVELRLAVEADCACDRKWERRLVDEGRLQAELLLDLDLPLELLDLVSVLGVDDVRGSPEVAVDAALVDTPRDPFERRLVRVGVDASALVSEALAQLRVRELVSGRDLGSCVSGRPSAHGLRLEDCDTRAPFFEQRGSC
jgi:hypothetical protein